MGYYYNRELGPNDFVWNIFFNERRLVDLYFTENINWEKPNVKILDVYAIYIKLLEDFEKDIVKFIKKNLDEINSRPTKTDEDLRNIEKFIFGNKSMFYFAPGYLIKINEYLRISDIRNYNKDINKRIIKSLFR